MKKEYLMMSIVAVTTLLASLLIIRSLAPQLLGLPPDMVLVQASQEIPPFYENAFREDIPYDDYSIHDPYTRLRSKPFYPKNISMGPNDMLGFRNQAIPAVADVVVIGDSQTYGNNAVLADNWPSQAQAMIAKGTPVFYSMSTGGWSAVQYLNMMKYARQFQPRVVVVAYYTGNDPLESFSMAYGIKEFSALIPDRKLKASDAPSVPFPEPASEMWLAKFNGGVQTIFTPNLRLASNNPDSPAAMAGWKIMLETADLIASRALKLGIKPVFTIIPTKEWVYAERVKQEGLQAPEKYIRLVNFENKNINRFRDVIEKLPGATYADVASALRTAAKLDVPLYMRDPDGHPIAEGYHVMATAIAPSIEKLLPSSPTNKGPIAVKQDKYTFCYLITGDGMWAVTNLDILKKNGWDITKIPFVASRDIASLHINGVLSKVDPEKFGPVILELK